MTLARPLLMLVMIFMLVGLQACAGDTDMTCEEVRIYQLAKPGKRVVVPEDLDSLELLREIPLPEASPQAARPPGSECIDMPPVIQLEN